MLLLASLSGANVDLIHRNSKNILKKGVNGTNNAVNEGFLSLSKAFDEIISTI